MVDSDRLDELVSGTTEEKSDDKTKKKSPSGGKTKKKGSGGGKKKKTKKEKLDQFKSNKSTSRGGSADGGGTEDIKKLLFCLANMDAYTRVVTEYDYDQFNKPQRKIKKEFAKDVSGEITNFLGVFGVRDITDEYGYSWKNIMDISLNNQDMTGQTLRTNSGNVKSSDVKELLDCIANILLYVEGNLRNKQNMSKQKQRDATIEVVADNIYEQYKSIVSSVGVQRIAEKHNLDWEDDVIRDVLENQDFKSKIDR